MGRVVAEQFRTVKVTTPLGTTQTAPQTVTWDLGPVILVSLSIMIPRGHSGLTGIHVDYQGVALVPFASPATFLVANDETVTVPVDVEIGAALSVVTYNTDSFDHAHYLRAVVNVIVTDQAASSPAPVLLDLSAVAS